MWSTATSWTLQLTRLVGVEAAASGLVRGLDQLTGLGITDSLWLALVPADALIKALRATVPGAIRHFGR